MEPITLILGTIGTFLGAFGKISDSYKSMRVRSTCEDLAYIYAKNYIDKNYPNDKEKKAQILKYAVILARNQYYENRFNYEDWLQGKVDIDLTD